MQSSLAKSNKFHSGKIKDYSNNMSIKDCTTFSTYGPFIHSLTALLLGLLVKFIAIEKAPQLFSGGGSRFMEFYFHPFSPSFFPSLSSPIQSPYPPSFPWPSLSGLSALSIGFHSLWTGKNSWVFLANTHPLAPNTHSCATAIGPGVLY